MKAAVKAVGKTVVITGGTRGIGLGLAYEFLRLGHRVAVCGRSREVVAEVAATLAGQYGAESVLARVCDVRDFGQVQALWDATAARFGRIDIWLNNAGLNAPGVGVWETDEATLRAVVEVNVLGMMYGSKVALAGCWLKARGSSTTWRGSARRGWCGRARRSTARARPP